MNDGLKHKVRPIMLESEKNKIFLLPALLYSSFLQFAVIVKYFLSVCSYCRSVVGFNSDKHAKDCHKNIFLKCVLNRQYF